MRNPPAAEIFNEELANLLKKKIKCSVTRLDDLSISFDYEGHVSAEETRSILERIRKLRAKSDEAAETPIVERANALREFGANLEKTFYSFEPDFFHQNIQRIVEDVISTMKGSIELWPTLVEICFFQKCRKGLPEIRVQNQKR